MRRKHPFTVHCAEPGCKESARYTYPSHRALVESYEFRKYGSGKEPWLCVRHMHGDGVLTMENRKVEWTSEAARPLEGRPPAEYQSFGNHGVLIGPGFYVEGKDFPIGTRIKVTVEAIVPDDVSTSIREFELLGK